jgi:hypothetical protein
MDGSSCRRSSTPSSRIDQCMCWQPTPTYSSSQCILHSLNAQSSCRFDPESQPDPKPEEAAANGRTPFPRFNFRQFPPSAQKIVRIRRSAKARTTSHPRRSALGVACPCRSISHLDDPLGGFAPACSTRSFGLDLGRSVLCRSGRPCSHSSHLKKTHKTDDSCSSGIFVQYLALSIFEQWGSVHTGHVRSHRWVSPIPQPTSWEHCPYRSECGF